MVKIGSNELNLSDVTKINKNRRKKLCKIMGPKTNSFMAHCIKKKYKIKTHWMWEWWLGLGETEIFM